MKEIVKTLLHPAKNICSSPVTDKRQLKTVDNPENIPEILDKQGPTRNSGTKNILECYNIEVEMQKYGRNAVINTLYTLLNQILQKNNSKQLE